MMELLFTLATVALVYALARNHDKATVRARVRQHQRRP